MSTYQIRFRKKVTVNTDPQGRCYDGCNFSEELRWTEWQSFGNYTKEDAELSVEAFKKLNPSREYMLVQGETK